MAALLAIGCGSSGDVAIDAGNDVAADAVVEAAPDSSAEAAEACACGICRGPLGTHWTKVSGTCPAPGAGDLVVSSLTDVSDPCSAIKRGTPFAVCHEDTISVDCHFDPATCAITATVTCGTVCIGDYAVTVAE